MIFKWFACFRIFFFFRGFYSLFHCCVWFDKKEYKTNDLVFHHSSFTCCLVITIYHLLVCMMPVFLIQYSVFFIHLCFMCVCAVVHLFIIIIIYYGSQWSSSYWVKKKCCTLFGLNFIVKAKVSLFVVRNKNEKCERHTQTTK